MKPSVVIILGLSGLAVLYLYLKISGTVSDVENGFNQGVADTVNDVETAAQMVPYLY